MWPGQWGLGWLGPPAVRSTSPAVGTAQHRCLQCSEQQSLLAGCAVAAGAGSPSLPCPPLPVAAPQEGHSSKSPPPLTLPCLTGSRCRIPLPGARLWGSLCHAEPWVPGGGCPAHERVHLLGL